VVNLVVGVKLFLQLDNALVTLVQAARQCDNDVTLLYQKLLEPNGGVLVLAQLLTFTFNLVQLVLVFLSEQALLFFKGKSELRCVFNLLTAN
jgi:hypothetical protein